MFNEEIRIIEMGISDWIGTGMYVALYFSSLIYIFVKGKSSKVKNVFGVSSIIMLFIILNPLFTLLVKGVFTSSIYWRFFWILPMGFTMAYVAADIVSSVDGKTNKAFLIAGMILCLVFSGKLIYNSENYIEVENLFKIPDEALLITNIILEDKTDVYKKAMLPTECVSYIRQVSSKISLMYERNPTGYINNKLVKEYEEGNVDYIATQCIDNNCNYIVIRKNIILDGEFAEYGYDYYGETVNYVIVRNNSIGKN